MGTTPSVSAKDGFLKLVEKNNVGEIEAILNTYPAESEPINEALRIAANKGYTRMVELLLKHGADPTLEHNYALRAAATRRYKNILG